ncbi:MAG: hypothetical protein A2030_08395 [Chloroflexi bacterium RBG_19FT_COMBO_50_10]|nr:MAG: hypothetical protein A2030_08395 [Chloroflexi bacterium RBG_19FT_COMBO_50_10]
MPTICPNCLRLVRTGAKYCGFCGTNLFLTTKDESVALPVSQEKASINQKSKKQKQAKPKRFRTSQVVSIISIILLLLVIVLALIVRYWSEFSQFVVQILSLLFGR